MKTKELYKIIKRKNEKCKWILNLAYVATILFTLVDMYFFNSNITFIMAGIVVIQSIFIISLINIHSNVNQISIYELRLILKKLNCQYQISSDYCEYIDHYYIGNKKFRKVFLIVYDDYLDNDKMISNEVVLEQLKDIVKKIKRG